MQKTIFVGILTLTLASASTPCSAHGFVGDRFFPPTIQTDDPFATDELALPTISLINDPDPSGGPKIRDLELNASFTKEIFPKFALSISDTYTNLKQRGTDPSALFASYFSNLQFNGKYQLWENPEHEFIVSTGLSLDLGGTGTRNFNNSFSTLTPLIYFGKGCGDLPEELKYLRPFALTGEVGQNLPLKGADACSLDWGFALEYSLPYLQQHVEDIGLPHPVQDIIPLVEFSLNTPENRGYQTSSGGITTGTINPGLLWEGKYCQIGAEAIIPINQRTGSDLGAVVQVQIYIDDLFPKIFGHPIFGKDDDK